MHFIYDDFCRYAVRALCDKMRDPTQSMIGFTLPLETQIPKKRQRFDMGSVVGDEPEKSGSRIAAISRVFIIAMMTLDFENNSQLTIFEGLHFSNRYGHPIRKLYLETSPANAIGLSGRITCRQK
jgi:hypothetical protein